MELFSSASSPLNVRNGEEVRRAGSTSRTSGLGYLGSTSFSAVYREEKGLEDISYDFYDMKTTNTDRSQPLYLPNRDSQIKKGITCLALLVDMPTLEEELGIWHEHYAGLTLIYPFTSGIEEVIRTSLHNVIANAQGAELESLLAQKSAEIYRNSMKEFKVPSNCTIDQYANILGDPSLLRWETLGMYFTAVGVSACYINQGVPWHVVEQRRKLAKSMLEASDTCLSLCEELGQMTDTEIWLYYENSHLASVVEGDSSYMFWRRLGDLLTAIVTKGLHTEIEVSPDVPFWLSEIRKRTFCHAYNLDKSISTFMGRPPRLPRKYCAMQLPLDLDVAHLRLPPADLEIELDQLDEDGWNTAGEYRSTCYSRTALICNMIREDILELALASLPNDNIAVAEDILRRSRSAWASFPSWIREIQYKTNVGGSAHDLGVVNNLWSNEIPLNFRYNEFLLYRAVVKRFPTNEANEQELLRLSAETLTIVMNSVNHANVLGKYNCDLPWTLAKFALPTAGVLALELLRQSQGLSPRRPGSCFNRSAVIQSLSNLVASLHWAVLPFDGNYEICNQAKQVLQRILDRVLSPPIPQARSTATKSPSTANSGAPGAGTDSEVVTSNADDYSWLNQVSSEPEFWSSLPTHPMFAA